MSTWNRISLHLTDADGPFINRPRPPRVGRWIERILVVIGLVCLGYLLYVYGEERLYQSFEDKQLDAILQRSEHFVDRDSKRLLRIDGRLRHGP